MNVYITIPRDLGQEVYSKNYIFRCKLHTFSIVSPEKSKHVAFHAKQLLMSIYLLSVCGCSTCAKSQSNSIPCSQLRGEMDYKQLNKPCDWLTASVVMVFIPTDGHGYRGNGNRIGTGSISGKNMLNTLGTSHHHFSLTLTDTGCECCAPKTAREVSDF